MSLGLAANRIPETNIAQIGSLRDGVRQWLLSDQVQLADGDQRGAIAGLLDASGKPEFVYGEITGYWLRWCSLYAPDQQKLRSAVEWIHRQWQGEAPGKTRVGPGADWRNQAVFSFDLGMMLQGLADAAPIVGADICGAAAKRLAPWLDRMVTDNGIGCYVPVGTGELPTRWSTTPGPFQVKTAACLLGTPEGWLSADVREAAKRTFARWHGDATSHNELHARCYGMEGNLRLGAHLPSSAASNLPLRDGCLPEYASDPNSGPRSDVQAQALRLHCLLKTQDADKRWAIANVLMQHIEADGSVRFDSKSGTRNVWCAMFAHQALDWFSEWNGGTFTRTATANDLI